MQIVDVNVLLYATDESAHHHPEARRWLDEALNGSVTIGFAWIVVLAFLRLSTHRAIATEPLTPDQAIEILEAWLARPNAVLVEPSPRHLGLLRGLLEEVGAAGNLVNDAHLAALALDQRAEIISFDGDFERFRGVRRVVPGG